MGVLSSETQVPIGILAPGAETIMCNMTDGAVPLNPQDRRLPAEPSPHKVKRRKKGKAIPVTGCGGL
jgi:hypothetical protein